MNPRDTAHSIHSCNNRAEIRSGVFIIGLLLIVVLCGVTAYNNYFLQNSKLSGNHLPVGSILALFFLAVFVNVPLKKFANHLAFSSSELIVIWVMLFVTLGIPSMGFLQFLLIHRLTSNKKMLLQPLTESLFINCPINQGINIKAL